ncbi:hypothetical protein [Mycobacterium riyadhense]|uniref:hypothetical protein n=1 Tax=Mycobacterium riyadhense TaxID=486698 RepID=UPI0019561FC0|nr:hypothetical protein [Mycobacterium riyadhense]
MTTVETIPAPGTAAGADIEPIESASTQADWRARYPARAVETHWQATCGDRGEVDRVVGAAATELPTQRVREARRGVCRCCWTGSPTSPARPGSSGGWPAVPTQRAKTGHKSLGGGFVAGETIQRTGWS